MSTNVTLWWEIVKHMQKFPEDDLMEVLPSASLADIKKAGFGLKELFVIRIS